MSKPHGYIVAAALLLAVAAASAWTPPVGVPAPPFGIDETHMMYAGQTYDFGSGPVPYPDAGNGPYTHYIDVSSPAATDTSNTYGTPTKPRKTVPWNLPAGSVVEIHGGPYGTPNPYTIYWTWFSAAGTAEKPVFIRGCDASTKPVLTGLQIRVGGSYLIIENLELNNTTIGPKFNTADPDGFIHHISMRNLDSHGIPPTNGTAVGASRGHYIVIYNNHIHDHGDRHYYTENDIHGCTAGAQAKYVWIVDNHIHDVGGDSVQINSGNVDPSLYARYVYIARNVMHSNGENAVDLKECWDTVVSQNEMYDFTPSHFAESGSDGTAMVIHYSPIDVWVINNHITSACNGIRCNGAVRGFIVNNLIHNIHHEEGEAGYDPNSIWASGAGVITWGTPELHVAGNTIYDCDAGFESPGGGTQAHYLYNNIIANLSQPTSHHIGILVRATSDVSNMDKNCLYQPGGSARIRWGSSSPVYSLAQFQATFPGKGLGCTQSDPLLADPANGDMRLRIGPVASPAIDAGSNAGFHTYADIFQSLYGMPLTIDYAGTARPQGVAVDMGAYESTRGVLGRYLFYGNSAFAAASDDAAIATDKMPLLPGHAAGFANYSSYCRGINGVMLDVSDAGQPTAADFEFRIGNDSNPADWALAATPSIIVQPNGGAAGADRIVFTWPDGAIAGEWLQVKVLATAETGLALPDVFYFGSAPGDTGNSASDAQVTPADEVAVRNNPHTAGANPADIDEPCDFDRDGRVGPADAVIARNNGTNSGTALQLIAVP